MMASIHLLSIPQLNPKANTEKTHPPRSSKLQGRWSSAAGSGTGCVRALPDAALRATATTALSPSFPCGRAVMSMGGSAALEGAGAPCASKYGGVPATKKKLAGRGALNGQ